MSKLVILFLVGALSGVAGYSIWQDEPVTIAVAPIEDAPPQAPAQQTDRLFPAPASPNTSSRMPAEGYSQSYGTICSTPQGECIVPQLPINSFCDCNGTPGRIVR